MEYRIGLARVCDRLGSLPNVEPTGDKTRTKHYERALTIYEELCRKHLGNNDCLFGLALAYQRLSHTHSGKGDYEKALAFIDQSLDTLGEIRKRTPHSRQVLLYLGYYQLDKADFLNRLKKEEEAFRCCKNALILHRGVAALNPLVSRYQWAFAASLRDFAKVLASRRQYGLSQKFCNMVLTQLA